MKTVTLSIIFFITLVSTSCTKKTVSDITTTDTVHLIDTIFGSHASSIISLFANKQWICDTMYSNYTVPGTGTLIYSRGGTGNTDDLDNTRSIYWPDGTEDTYDESGNYIPYTWNFTSADSMSFDGHKDGITNHVKILRLDATHLIVHDSTYQTYAVSMFKQ